jgi:hypothetical protein
MRPIRPRVALDGALFSAAALASIALCADYRALHRRPAGLCIARGWQQVRGRETRPERCPEALSQMRRTGRAAGAIIH